MRHHERVIKQFQAADYLAEHWPDWRVYETTDLPPTVTERFVKDSKIVLVDTSTCGREWGLAHVAGHLDLGHHLVSGAGFTAVQESEANFLAEVRMDYDLADIPLDGEPSLPRP